MKFELLLLLIALIGPFCTITHASTLVVPTQADLAGVTESLEPNDASEPAKVHEVTEAPEELVTNAPTLPSTAAAVDVTEESAREVTATEAPVLPTTLAQEELATTEAEPQTTEAPALKVEVTTEKPLDNETIAPEVAENDTQTELEVEDSALSTGHVVGIVIGALVAVVIIIAVIVVVVRRMGQYSP